MSTEQLFFKQRQHMVEEHVEGRGISDPATLAAMREVPRHRFIPEQMGLIAYVDSPLPIGHGQTISQPYIVALMTEAAQLDSNCTVLEIGTGSGYAAGVLSRIVKTVYTIERLPYFQENALRCYRELGYDNIHTAIGDGSLGWPEKAPFDAIIVTAGAPVVPESLLKQLVVGGRLIIPIGEASMQQLLRFYRQEEGVIREVLESVRFVPLIGKEGWVDSDFSA